MQWTYPSPYEGGNPLAPEATPSVEPVAPKPDKARNLSRLLLSMERKHMTEEAARSSLPMPSTDLQTALNTTAPILRHPTVGEGGASPPRPGVPIP